MSYLVDPMKIYGEAVECLVTSTFTWESYYTSHSTRQRRSIKTLSQDASVSWSVFSLSWTSWQMWTLFMREQDMKCKMMLYSSSNYWQHFHAFAKKGLGTIWMLYNYNTKLRNALPNWFKLFSGDIWTFTQIDISWQSPNFQDVNF